MFDRDKFEKFFDKNTWSSNFSKFKKGVVKALPELMLDEHDIYHHGVCSCKGCLRNFARKHPKLYQLLPIVPRGTHNSTPRTGLRSSEEVGGCDDDDDAPRVSNLVSNLKRAFEEAAVDPEDIRRSPLARKRSKKNHTGKSKKLSKNVYRKNRIRGCGSGGGGARVRGCRLGIPEFDKLFPASDSDHEDAAADADVGGRRVDLTKVQARKTKRQTARYSARRSAAEVKIIDAVIDALNLKDVEMSERDRVQMALYGLVSLRFDDIANAVLKLKRSLRKKVRVKCEQPRAWAHVCFYCFSS